jgi:hypothetical protein
MNLDLVKLFGVVFIVLISWCCVMFAIALTFGWFEDDWIELHDSKDGGRR